MFRENSESSDNPRKKEVRRFCFPSGIRIKRIKDNEIQRMLNQQHEAYNKNESFVFKIGN